MKLLCCIIFTSILCSVYAQGEIAQNDTDNGIDPRNIRVWLYTRTNTSKPQFDLAVNETDILTNETYDPSNSMLVVIHGFKGTSNETTYLRIKDGYLLKGGWNVILLDWAPLSNVDRYALAVSNANTVALLFAKFLNAMASKGLLDFDKIDLVGFSIGSHIAGMTGKHVNGKISRIIALDPAYPLYDGKDSNERLHVDDAQFVAVIHTSGKFISFEDSLGHADFYPNGGKFPQPLCLDINLSGGSGLQIIPVMICSHTIVVEYFADSVFNENQFMSMKCQSWDDYLNDTCASDKIPMGFATPKSARGNYYLKIY